MPVITGSDVGRELRKMGFNGLLILFSLHAGSEIEVLAKEVGFDAVVPKTTSHPIEQSSRKCRSVRLVLQQKPLREGLKRISYRLIRSFSLERYLRGSDERRN